MVFRSPPVAWPPVVDWGGWDLTWYAIDSVGELAAFCTNTTDWSPIEMATLHRISDELPSWCEQTLGLPEERFGPEALGLWVFDAALRKGRFDRVGEPAEARLLTDMPALWAELACAVYFEDLRWAELPSIPTDNAAMRRWFDGGVLWSELGR